MTTMMLKKTLTTGLISLIIATGFQQPASAGLVNGIVTVATSVLSFCSVSGSAIPFGLYSSSQVDQTGNISVLCTFGTSYNIGLDAGTGTGATTAVRKMTGATSGGTLNYALYRDAARTSVWGSTIGTNTVSGIGIGLFQNVTVYGRIAASQTPNADTYADTVTITLTY